MSQNSKMLRLKKEREKERREEERKGGREEGSKSCDLDLLLLAFQVFLYNQKYVTISNLHF